MRKPEIAIENMTIRKFFRKMKMKSVNQAGLERNDKARKMKKYHRSVGDVVGTGGWRERRRDNVSEKENGRNGISQQRKYAAAWRRKRSRCGESKSDIAGGRGGCLVASATNIALTMA